MPPLGSFSRVDPGVDNAAQAQSKLSEGVLQQRRGPDYASHSSEVEVRQNTVEVTQSTGFREKLAGHRQVTSLKDLRDA